MTETKSSYVLSSPWIQEIEGEPCRYFVQSETRRDVLHLVDLEENDGIGKCGCEEFSFRIQPILNQHGTMTDFARECRCKHIIRALVYHAEKEIRTKMK